MIIIPILNSAGTMCTQEKLQFFLVPPYCKKLGVPKDTEDHEPSEEMSLAKIEVSNPSRILQLIEDLTDKSTKKLEIKINRYVS